MFLKLLTYIKLQRVGITFASVFGLIWLFLEPAGLFLPELLDWGWWGYLSLATLSLILSVIFNFPRRVIYRFLSSPDTKVEIKIGDLFDEPDHLVIGINDVFDTELGEVIKPTSVQGQFLARVYKGDRRRLDAEIDLALETIQAYKIYELDKRKGKQWRYPIGTTIALGSPDRRYFLNAYGCMGNDLKGKRPSY